MKKFIFIVLLLPCWSLSKAQIHPYIYNPYDSLAEYAPARILKFSYLSLFDYKQSIQFAYEYKIRPRVTLQNELGYINTLIKGLYSYENFQNMRGIRTRFEARFYRKNRFNQVNGFYLAPEIFYVYTQYQRQKELGRGCVSGTCDFFELKRFQVYKNVVGVHFKVGVQIDLSPKLLLDIYGGLGLRMVYIHAPEAEKEDFRLNEFFFQYNNGEFLRPSMALGLKLGYILK